MDININALDDMDSLLWASNSGAWQGFSYSPFGGAATRSGGDNLLPGFNGERLDPVDQRYNLGNGYRAYNPVLMRFNAPDSWSPFGNGGLNQYAYCEGDPINLSDPSGHMSTGAAVKMGLGIFVGILGAILSFGAAIAVEGAMATAALCLAGLSGVTGAVSAGTKEADPEESKVLGWVSLGLGIASLGVGLADQVHGKVIGRSASCALSNDAKTKFGGGSQAAPSPASAESLQAQKLGEHFYVFKGSENSTRAILTAHGVETIFYDVADLPEGSEVRYFAPEGRILNNPHLFNAGPDRVIPVGGDKGKTRRYLLSKYGQDDYKYASEVAKKYKVDVISVQEKRISNFEPYPSSSLPISVSMVSLVQVTKRRQ